MKNPKQTLILASSSEYRRQLLQKLQIPFTSIAPKIDETAYPDEKPHETALRLAQEKARKIGSEYPHALIIGCDQVATLDGEQLGKPGNHQNATKQLQKMRGREVTFHSALCLYNAATDTMQAQVVPYLVRFRMLTDDQIENYLSKTFVEESRKLREGVIPNLNLIQPLQKQVEKQTTNIPIKIPIMNKKEEKGLVPEDVWIKKHPVFI